MNKLANFVRKDVTYNDNLDQDAETAEQRTYLPGDVGISKQVEKALHKRPYSGLLRNRRDYGQNTKISCDLLRIAKILISNSAHGERIKQALLDHATKMVQINDEFDKTGDSTKHEKQTLRNGKNFLGSVGDFIQNNVYDVPGIQFALLGAHSALVKEKPYELNNAIHDYHGIRNNIHKHLKTLREGKVKTHPVFGDVKKSIKFFDDFNKHAENPTIKTASEEHGEKIKQALLDHAVNMERINDARDSGNDEAAFHRRTLNNGKRFLESVGHLIEHHCKDIPEIDRALYHAHSRLAKENSHGLNASIHGLNGIRDCIHRHFNNLWLRTSPDDEETATHPTFGNIQDTSNYFDNFQGRVDAINKKWK